MTCKGCADRKARLQAWIRRKLGIDQVITSQGEAFVNYVDQKNALVCDGLEALQLKTLSLTEAGAELETMIKHFDVAVQKIGHALNNNDEELSKRLEALRNLIRENRLECRKIRDLIRDQDSEITDLSVAVKKIEFPEYEEIGKTFPDG